MDHRYMWPPPPPPPHMPASATADPYQRPPPPVPPPSNQPWTTYSTPQQFQYHPQPHHSPPPPPPHWVAPPPSSDHSQYPPPSPLPPPPPYAHQTPPYPGNPHYPPPRPPHVAQPYPQDWGSGSWSQHQSWQYPNNSNEEDWASKARAWAAAKAATDNQQPQSQFVPAARPEGQHHFHNQFSQPVDPQFSDVHRPLTQASSYEQYPVEMGPPIGSGLGHSQEARYSSSGQSSYAADIHSSYVDGSVAGNSIPPFSQHDKSSLSPSVHQQEVPSSYSSHAGYDPDNRYEEFNSSSSQPVSQHHVQPLTSASGRSGWMEEPNHLQGSQRDEFLSGLSDQPLNFAPHFNRNLDPHVQPNYTHSSGGLARAVDPAAMSSNYAWPPSSAPGVFYPPATTMMSSGPQVDHPTAVTPVSGHPTTMFPTGPGFHPNVPMTGATFGIGSGVTPHPTAFSGDPYGVSSMSERPKKASVPNWLREEIIKNKAVITSSTVELSKEDSQSVEEDFNDKFPKRDQADSRSIDSSRSTEDEDEEEVEAARTAAINQEIKRILTEVLLKVTDELFDEIATRVLNEDDLSVGVGNDIDLSNDQPLPSTQATLTPKASAKILIPTKAQEVNVNDASENSISSSAGDVLGLGSYASDEEDDEIQNSGKLKSKESFKHLQLSSSKDLEDHPVFQNGSSRKLTEEQSNDLAKLKADVTDSKSAAIYTADISVASAELNNTRKARESASGDNQRSSKRPFLITGEESQRGSECSKSNKSLTEKAGDGNERPGGRLDAIRSSNDNFQTSSIGNRPDKNDGHENQQRSSLKNVTRSESVKERPEKKVDEESRRKEEGHTRVEKKDYLNGSKDKRKEKGRTDEKTKDSDSRKRRSPADANGGASRSGREKRQRDKEDTDDRRRDKTRDEKKERSRHDTVSDSGRHKRHMSPSVDGKEKENKDNLVSHANDYSDQSSDDSKRRARQSRRHKSPSPIRQRKRQVSRSPHSKHSSKRRHSPSYSSLETTRGKRSPSRSRSRSPVHRRR